MQKGDLFYSNGMGLRAVETTYFSCIIEAIIFVLAQQQLVCYSVGMLDDMQEDSLSTRLSA